MVAASPQAQAAALSSYFSGGGTSLPLFKVFMAPEAAAMSSEVLLSGYIGQGPRVEAFEAALKDWFSSEYILSLNSGTSALHLALRLAGVGQGDEVVSTPMTCMATNTPILANGANIVWADIDPNTGCISPESVRAKITPKTKAIMAVDWAGYPCDLNELQAIANEHGIKLIEDAAHAFGATYNGQKVGGIADFTCYSFQAIKHLTTVDGGALVCKSEEDYKRGKLLRWYGIDRDGPRKDFRCEEDVVEYGYKFHMNDVAAAIGLAQLPHMPELVRKHCDNAKYYTERFKGLEAVEGLPVLLDYKADREAAYWLFTIRVDEPKAFMAFMKERQIVCSQVHARNDGHTVFKAYRTELPGVDKFSAHQVSIPVGWWLSSEDRERVADAVTEYVNR